MTKYWIFNIANQKYDGEVFQGIDIFRELVVKRKIWGLGKKTCYVKRLQKNDFYSFQMTGEKTSHPARSASPNRREFGRKSLFFAFFEFSCYPHPSGALRTR